MGEKTKASIGLALIIISLCSLLMFFCALESMIEQQAYWVALVWGLLTCIGLQIGYRLDR